MLEEIQRLIASSEEKFDLYEMENLPENLKRNSLNHYYLSVYPSIGQMRLVSDENHTPSYPKEVSSLYIHTPFCTDICDFCSYLVYPTGKKILSHLDKSEELLDIEDLDKTVSKISDYFKLLKKEIEYHATQTELKISYIYFGGGSPNLIPIKIMENFLIYLKQFSQSVMFGTIELHPEFFADPSYASRFLNMIKSYGINRVSIGYQSSNDDTLDAHNRRHTSSFIHKAVEMTKSLNIMLNLDLMYGLPEQTLEVFGETLIQASNLKPDSISTYFLFVNEGTALESQIKRNAVSLPTFRTVQVQHIMAQEFLSREFYELPNDFFARRDSLYGDPETYDQSRLPSKASSLPIGAGAYGFYSNTQFCNPFDLKQYKEKIISGSSPIWRCYSLNDDELIYRDIMFSFKNDPCLNMERFFEKYRINLVEDPRFANNFNLLLSLNLIKIHENKIILTSKGKLCVEEISCLFKNPEIAMALDYESSKLLKKHNFSPTYEKLSKAEEKSEQTVSLANSRHNLWNYQSIAIASVVAIAAVTAVSLYSKYKK